MLSSALEASITSDSVTAPTDPDIIFTCISSLVKSLTTCSTAVKAPLEPVLITIFISLSLEALALLTT